MSIKVPASGFSLLENAKTAINNRKFASYAHTLAGYKKRVLPGKKSGNKKRFCLKDALAGLAANACRVQAQEKRNDRIVIRLNIQ